MKEPLTERQSEVYEFICDYTKKNLFPPTYEEISQNTKASGKNEVFRIICILEKKGYIKVKKFSARAITIVGYQFSEVGA